MKFITHPNNLSKIKQQIEKDYGQTDDDILGLHRPKSIFGFEVITDKDIEETKLFPTGRFKRNPDHSLRDTRYFEWVTQNEIERLDSLAKMRIRDKDNWKLNVGLIVEIFEERPVYYAMSSRFAFNGNTVCKL